MNVPIRMNRWHSLPGLIAITLSIAVSGCALMVNGTTEEMHFTSEPSDAAVFVDSVLIGRTPLTHDVKRKKAIDVVFAKDGYQIKQLHLEAGYDSKFLWMDVFSYFIGGIIDLNSDACYNWEYDFVDGVLKR